MVRVSAEGRDSVLLQGEERRKANRYGPEEEVQTMTSSGSLLDLAQPAVATSLHTSYGWEGVDRGLERA